MTDVSVCLLVTALVVVPVLESTESKLFHVLLNVNAI